LHSDGELTPLDLITKAHGEGVRQLALTDHDCISGVLEAQRLLENPALQQNLQGFRLVTGIELSARWQGVDVHVLGLSLNPKCELLRECISEQQERRVERAQRIAEKLAKKGFAGTYEGALAQALSPEQITRPHFARYLVEIGAVKTGAEAFKRFLGYGKAAFVATDWIDIKKAIDVIQHSQGLAVLAHPAQYKLTNAKLRRLVAGFSAAGGDGLEVVSGQQTDQLSQYLAKLAEDHRLYASQGSDFHGSDRPWSQLGRMGKLPKQCAPIWELPRWAKGTI